MEAHGHYPPALQVSSATRAQLAQLALLALKMACANPANQMIYQALLNKAASYTNQPYKARAYKKAATSISNCPFDLRTKEHPEDIFFIGPRIAKYIKDFINHPCPTCPPIIKRETAEGTPMPKCQVPANQPIYQALIEKAASYPASQAYQAKAYKKAAESIRTCELDLNNRFSEVQHLDGVGYSIEAFIYDIIHPTPPGGVTLTQLHAPSQCSAEATMKRYYEVLPPAPEGSAFETMRRYQQNVQAHATGGGISSAQISSSAQLYARPDTKGSGPFGYLADADETEEDEFRTTLIPTCDKMTVQQLIHALQAAVKKNPAVASMEVIPDLLDDSNIGPYEVIIDSHIVFITSGHRNPY